MRYKDPFEFDIIPDEIRTGTRWVTVSLKNISSDRLNYLDIRLYSRNPSFIDIKENGHYIPVMETGEKKTQAFQVDADLSTNLYATVSGNRNGEYFFWISPNMYIQVGVTTAKLRNVFALTHPYAPEETLEAEAVVEGVTGGDNFKVIFWHESASKYEKLGESEIENINAGEVKKASIEFTPDESGLHTIYGYLYDDAKYIGTDSDIIWVE